MGIKLPTMGKQGKVAPDQRGNRIDEPAAHYAIANASLANAIFTQTQQRVLGLLFGQPDKNFTVSEAIALADGGSGAVQRELQRLSAGGLVTVTQIGNQKRYQANADAPIHAELVGILQKTTGLAGPLREALAPLADEIAVAFVYGSIAKRSDTATSDVDLMIVSDTLGYAEVFGAVETAAKRLRRAVNPTVYTRPELAKRIRSGNAFVSRMLDQPKIWLIGDERELRI